MKHSDRVGVPELDPYRAPSPNRCTLMILKISLAKKFIALTLFIYCFVVVDFSGYLYNNKINSSFEINFKNFHQPSTFILSPNLQSCRRKKPPIIIVMVVSRSENFAEREAIRSSWASSVYSKAIKDGRAAVHFVVSRPTAKESVLRLSDEVKKYSDVLLADLEETYDNLILKVYASIAFTTKYCGHASFHMKVDDDVVVHLDRLFHYLVDTTSTRNSLMCKVWAQAKPIRDKRNKWFVSKKQWPRDSFPRYCNGPMYLIGMSAARKILSKVKDLDLITLEDVFFTGVAAEKASLKHVSWSKHLRSRDEELWWGVSECDRRGEPFVFAVHSLNTTAKMKKGFETLRNLRCANSTEVQKRRNESLKRRSGKGTVASAITDEDNYTR